MWRIISLLPIFLFPILCLAQPGPEVLSTHGPSPARYRGPHFDTVADSIEFTRFKERLEQEVPAEHAGNVDYRLMWWEEEHPGRWAVHRGDGRSLRAVDSASTADPRSRRGGILRFLGGGFLVLERELPLGTIHRDAWYFEAP